LNTELQFSVIYLSQENNDINDFDFFIRMIPTKDGNVVSVSVVPRFCLDGKIVKHIKFSVVADKIIDATDVIQTLAQLKDLKEIVSDINLSTSDAEARLKDLIEKVINP